MPLIMKKIIWHLRLLAFFSIFWKTGLAQTDEQLQDPTYLREQYNRLVEKHNALIAKAQALMSSKQESPAKPQTHLVDLSSMLRAEYENKLDAAETKAAELELKLSRTLRQGQKLANDNAILEEGNARLRNQLNIVTAEERDLLDRSKEVAMENRRLIIRQKKTDLKESQLLAKLRNIEASNQSLRRR
ncbi:uncharacterized protein METZ01_LOCUS470292, partial [marine metagenome]